MIPVSNMAKRPTFSGGVIAPAALASRSRLAPQAVHDLRAAHWLKGGHAVALIDHCSGFCTDPASANVGISHMTERMQRALPKS